MPKRVLPRQESMPVTSRQQPQHPAASPPPHAVGSTSGLGGGGIGGGSSGFYDKRNPLFGVSTGFMREAGYAPLSRLIAGTAPATTITSTTTPARNATTGRKHVLSTRSMSHDETRGGVVGDGRRGSLADGGDQHRETTFSEEPSSVHSGVRSDDNRIHPATGGTAVEMGQSGSAGVPNQYHQPNNRGLMMGMVLRKKKGVQEWNPQQSLKEKRLLMTRRIRACDCSLVFAAAGILLTIIEAELTHADQLAKDSLASILIQCLAVISTLALLSVIVYYHYTELKIAAIDSGTFDWRVGLTWERILQCSVEFCVCAICPIPGDISFDWVILRDPRHAACAPVRLDVVLSIPMFLRFYLVCRFIVLRSRQFQDAATRSIASLNYITMNFQFVIRTLIDENPLRVMTVFSLCFCVLVAWILTQCDRYSDFPVEAAQNRFYLNALWFVVVTYISIGYGDVVPLSYCARALAIFTGVVGKIVSSVLIAVMSRQMELSRGEVHVHNFVSDSKLSKERKHAAARVLQNIWHIHWYKRKGGTDESKLRQHQRHFLAAIAEFRRIKWEQRRLAEASNSFLELSIGQKEMSDTVWTLQRSQCALTSQVALLTERLHELTLLAANLTQQQPLHQQGESMAAAKIDQRLRAKLATIDVEERKSSIGCALQSMDYAE